MELLCPACMGTLAIADNHTARCTVHGGTYQVLFRRRLSAVIPRDVATGPALDANPSESAATGEFPPPIAAPPRFAGMHCVQHPSVPATARCDSCGAYMCATCDFALPGAMHVCPSCAVSSQDKLSAKRKHALLWSFALAVWCTLALAAFFVAAGTGMVKTKQDELAIGLLFSLGILIPSIIGFALGLGGIDRRLRNPPVLWVATIWNGLILAVLLLLGVVGSLK